MLVYIGIFSSGVSRITSIAHRGGGGSDRYRDQTVTCNKGIGVCLHSKTHSLFMKYSNSTSTL